MPSSPGAQCLALSGHCTHGVSVNEQVLGGGGHQDTVRAAREGSFVKEEGNQRESARSSNICRTTQNLVQVAVCLWST